MNENILLIRAELTETGKGVYSLLTEEGEDKGKFVVVPVMEFEEIEITIERLKEALNVLIKDVSDCTSCDGSALDHDGESACRTCGGYGFNPAGDVRQDMLDAGKLLGESK